MICASCGAENPEGFRFCGACGAELPDTSAERSESRKIVTLLFCDVVGSTALGERLDPEALRRVMMRYFDEISHAVVRHGGTVEKFVGDAVMAIFGIPKAHEDDALRAVRAAVEIRNLLPSVAAELGVSLAWRTGVNTGEVVVGDGQTLATGDGINVAARLEQAAAPGEILMGSGTHRLVRGQVEAEPVEPLTLKGKAQPVPAFRLLRLRPEQPAEPLEDDEVFVGRDGELELLRSAFNRAAGDAFQLVTVLGAAGVGKSRLVARFLSDLGDRALVVRGRCLSYGDAITFFPIVEVLTQLGHDGADALRLVAGGGAIAPNEVFLAIRRAWETAARRRPLVVVLDDLHWAEPTLLDLVEHVVEFARDVPLLLLCVSRPELMDDRPNWGGGPDATAVRLEALHPTECQQLVERVAGRLHPAMRDRVASASEGNPLFALEMVALALEGGEVTTSPTIAAILAARLDGLGVDERAVIQRGAVEGTEFHSTAVLAMAPTMTMAKVDQQLADLARKELVWPQRAELYRFRHVLVRDAAYDALPKRQRAELHEQFADWIEANPAGLIELDEVVGWHLEQAVRYRRELVIDVDPRLATRAGLTLTAAAERAFGRADLPAAAKLFARALTLLPADAEPRFDASVTLAELAVQLGDFDRAEELLGEIETHDATPASVAARLQWMAAAAPEQSAGFVEQHALPMLEAARDSSDDAGLAALHLAVFHHWWFLADVGRSMSQLEQADHHARRAGKTTVRHRILMMGIGPLMFGPAPPDEIRRGIARREAAGGGPLVDAGACMLRTKLAFMEGDLAEARLQAGRCEAMLGELGMRVQQVTMAEDWAQLALAEGDPAEAVRILREADDRLRALGERGFRSTLVAMLAETLYLAGEPDEAERRALEAEEMSAAEDVTNFIIGHAVRSRVLADRGDLERAEELARSALAIAERTEFPVERSNAREALADVLVRQGRSAEAFPLLEEAAELCRRKGERTRADRLRQRLEELGRSG